MTKPNISTHQLALPFTTSKIQDTYDPYRNAKVFVRKYSSEEEKERKLRQCYCKKIEEFTDIEEPHHVSMFRRLEWSSAYHQCLGDLIRVQPKGVLTESVEHNTKSSPDTCEVSGESCNHHPVICTKTDFQLYSYKNSSQNETCCHCRENIIAIQLLSHTSLVIWNAAAFC